MKKIPQILLIGFITLFFSSCSFENEEDKRVRVKKELTEIIGKQNAVDLMDGGIADELNMFKSTWDHHGEDVNGAIEAQYSAAGGDGFVGDLAFLKFRQKLNLYGYSASDFNHIMTIQAEDWKEFNSDIDTYINRIEEEVQSTNNEILENEKEIERINNKEDYYANYSRKERKENIKNLKEHIDGRKENIDERNSAKEILIKIKTNGYSSLTDDEKIDILVFHYEKNPRIEFDFSYLQGLISNPKNLNDGLAQIESFIPLLDKINKSGAESLTKEEKSTLNPNNSYADDYSFPNNVIEMRRTFIDSDGWNSKHWGYFLATDFHADSVQVSAYEDRDHLAEGGDSVVAAIWGYHINYAGLTTALKENPLKSGKKVYETYIGNSGSNKNRRNFLMFVTKKKHNANWHPEYSYYFRVIMTFDDTQKYSNRMIENYTNDWMINDEQYQFFMNVYNNLKTKKSS